MKIAVFAGGQSVMFFMQDALEELLKIEYGPDAILLRGAVPGSPIEAWQPGQPIFMNSVAMCLAAIADGFSIKIGAFDQGENNTFDVVNAATWSAQYGTFLDAFRTAIGSPYLPFVHAVLGKVPSDPAGPARPGWDVVRKQQILALYNRPACDRVDLLPFGPYAPGAPWCHYFDGQNGYAGIAAQFMRYIRGRVPSNAAASVAR